MLKLADFGLARSRASADGREGEGGEKQKKDGEILREIEKE